MHFSGFNEIGRTVTSLNHFLQSSQVYKWIQCFWISYPRLCSLSHPYILAFVLVSESFWDKLDFFGCFCNYEAAEHVYVMLTTPRQDFQSECCHYFLFFLFWRLLHNLSQEMACKRKEIVKTFLKVEEGKASGWVKMSALPNRKHANFWQLVQLTFATYSVENSAVSRSPSC